MLGKRKNDREPNDPQDVLTGICGTCLTVVELPRWQATRFPQEQAVGREPGVWSDLLFAECPHCHARVGLVRKTHGIVP